MALDPGLAVLCCSLQGPRHVCQLSGCICLPGKRLLLLLLCCLRSGLCLGYVALHGRPDWSQTSSTGLRKACRLRPTWLPVCLLGYVPPLAALPCSSYSCAKHVAKVGCRMVMQRDHHDVIW